MEALRDRIYEVAEQDHPVTIRQLFYRLVSVGAIEKTENEYKSTVVRLCASMRQAGELPWVWVADNTRWVRRPMTFEGPDDALRTTAALYRRSLWTEAEAYVEVWLEKEALAGVLHTVTAKWDVPLMVTRGYASLTFLQSSAEQFPDDRPTYVYYFGDLDPSGVDISRNTRERLQQFAGPDAQVEFRRVAVTDEQVQALELPTRPTKRSDSRARTWKGGSVEVDAIPPSTLREICARCIERHVDEDQLRVLLEAERSERRLLESLVQENES